MWWCRASSAPAARDALLVQLLADGPRAWVRGDRRPTEGSGALLLCPHDDEWEVGM